MNEAFMPLVIVSREVMDYVKEIARSSIKAGSYERPLLVSFEFEAFLSISSREAFLEELKEGLKL